MDFFDPKIPKQEVIVEILHTQSAQYLLKCVLFLNASSKYSEANTETIYEFLHNCGQFIPAKQITTDSYASKIETGPVSLYNINEIIYIKEFGACHPDELKNLSNIQVTLKNKSSFMLSINKNIMGPNSRLAEYVNNSSIFLKFIKNNAFIHLNKKYIFSIKNI